MHLRSAAVRQGGSAPGGWLAVGWGDGERRRGQLEHGSFITQRASPGSCAGRLRIPRAGRRQVPSHSCVRFVPNLPMKDVTEKESLSCGRCYTLDGRGYKARKNLGHFGHLPHVCVQFKRKHRIKKITNTPHLCGHPSPRGKFPKTLDTCCLCPGCLLVPAM